jgi:hypothetical protein
MFVALEGRVLTAWAKSKESREEWEARGSSQFTVAVLKEPPSSSNIARILNASSMT